jgi:hypothetical protein
VGPIVLDGSKDTIRAELKMRIQSLQLAQLFPTLKESKTSVGDIGGLVELSGSGRDNCPSGLSQSGAFELTATGETPNASTLDCDLDGTYTRFGTLASVTTSGTCVVNGFPAEVTFAAEVAVLPEQFSPMRTARFVAPFTVSPD